MRENNIFLYGSNGFIGTKLKKLIKKNKKNHVLLPNFSTKNHFNFTYGEYKNFWKNKIANLNLIVYLSFNNDLIDIQKNTQKNIKDTLIPLIALTEAIKDLQKKIRVIYLSTASIYGDQKKNLPVKEDGSINLQNIYDHLKLMSESILINANIGYNPQIND